MLSGFILKSKLNFDKLVKSVNIFISINSKLKEILYELLIYSVKYLEKKALKFTLMD